jgi:hypothetical protein
VSRILMTGFTPRQCGEPEPAHLDVPRAVAEALVQAGHEVDWREVRMGESLDGYDKLWLNVGPVGARHGLGALWSVASQIPSVAFLDNALYREDIKSAIDLGDNPSRLTDGLDETTQKFAAPFEKYLLGGAEAMQADFWKDASAVAPLFSFGNSSVVASKVPRGVDIGRMVTGIDPGFITKPHLTRAWNELGADGWPHREQTWVLGSTRTQGAYVKKVAEKAKWPVSQFGSSQRTFVPAEADVIKKYAASWGVLNPPLPQIGSGWFRPRFIYTAFVGSVLSCDLKDAVPPGGFYQYPPEWIENMNIEQRTQLSFDQREALWPTLGSEAEFIEKVSKLVS